MFVEEKSKGEVPDFKLGTLKLSTAIRIGAAKRPQCQGDYFAKGRSCALGAAWEGLGREYREYAGLIASGIQSILRTDPLVINEIVRRNDHGHETREQIADWLESKGL